MSESRRIWKKRTPALAIGVTVGAALAAGLAWAFTAIFVGGASGSTAGSVDTAFFFAAGSGIGVVVGACLGALLRQTTDPDERLTTGAIAGTGSALLAVVPVIIVYEQLQLLPTVVALVMEAVVLSGFIAGGSALGSGLAGRFRNPHATSMT